MKKLVTIAGIQTKAREDLAKNFSHAAGLVIKAAKKGAQIVCLQELYNAPYFPQYRTADKKKYAESIPGASTAMFSKIAKTYGVIIIVPIFEKKKNKQGKWKYYNAAAVIDHNGNLLQTYRKIHIPQDPLFYEKNYFKEGDLGYKIYKTKFGTFAVLICYDQWFPEAARMAALAGADVIFYPTAIGNIVGERAVEGDWHDAWETIMRGHAIANSVYVCAVNRVGREGKLTFWGQSFAANSFGKVLKRASATKEEVLVQKIDISKNKSIRQDWGFFRNRRPETYKFQTKK